MKLSSMFAAIAAVAALLGASPSLALANAPKAPPAAVPASAPVKQTAVPTAAPAPAVVTNSQIAECAAKELVALKMTERDARQIKVGASMPIMGIDRSFKRRDTIWGFCKVSLADPVIVRLAEAKAKTAAFSKELATLTSNVDRLTAEISTLTKERAVALTQVQALKKQLADMKTLVDADERLLAEQTRAKQAQVSAQSASKPQAPAPSATARAPAAQAPPAKS